MHNKTKHLFAGLSHVSCEDEGYDLGHGVFLKPTYAHLFSTGMMAFKKPAPGKHHPGPWCAVGGGFAYDINLELAIPVNIELPWGIGAEDAVWLIAALLRLANYPYLNVPVVSSSPFQCKVTKQNERLVHPFETSPRIFQATADAVTTIATEDLAWVKSVWPQAAKMMKDDATLSVALRAVDFCTVQERTASALLTAWGALEELFAPSRGELRFRVSANIAAYLQPPGPERLALYKKVSKLYNARSKAAHTAQNAEIEELLQSFVILRNALVKMIDAGKVPKQKDFEELLFCGCV